MKQQNVSKITKIERKILAIRVLNSYLKTPVADFLICEFSFILAGDRSQETLNFATS